jgi:hypothetical protein
MQWKEVPNEEALIDLRNLHYGGSSHRILVIQYLPLRQGVSLCETGMEGNLEMKSSMRSIRS